MSSIQKRNSGRKKAANHEEHYAPCGGQLPVHTALLPWQPTQITKTQLYFSHDGLHSLRPNGAEKQRNKQFSTSMHSCIFTCLLLVFGENILVGVKFSPRNKKPSYANEEACLSSYRVGHVSTDGNIAVIKKPS